MNYTQMNQRLMAVINTLENVSVKGYSNVINMAGAMQILSDTRQEVIQILQETEQRRRANVDSESVKEEE